MPVYHVKDPDSGLEMDLRGDSPPSEAELTQIFTELQKKRPPQDSAMRRFLTPLLPSTTPSDYVTGPLYALRHPIDSAQLLAGAIGNDPIGAVPIVGPVRNAITDAASGNYAGAAGNTIAAALPFAARSVRVPAGRVLNRAGLALETAGRAPETVGASRYGVVGELLRGDLKGAAGAAVLPPAATMLGRGVQAVGRGMAGLPSAEQSVTALVDAANRPTHPVALSQWEMNFVQSLDDQVKAGRPLSPSQKAIAQRLYATKLNSITAPATAPTGAPMLTPPTTSTAWPMPKP